MKYIRTKNGVYELATEITITEFQIIDHLHNRVFLKSEIQSQADTIEELCDEFVCWLNNQPTHFDLDENLTVKEVKKNLDSWKAKAEVYGCIWTDKGLIYVAKMNEKGELELI